MSELSYKDEAASTYDRAVAHVSTHFLPFLLRPARLKPGQRVLDTATGTGIAAAAALAGGRRCAPGVAPHLGS
jgi:ubiquinone/menaquinone biosynthesis C-methylase UbiE